MIGVVGFVVVLLTLVGLALLGARCDQCKRAYCVLKSDSYWSRLYCSRKCEKEMVRAELSKKMGPAYEELINEQLADGGAYDKHMETRCK